jgi:hypothetical protein
VAQKICHPPAVHRTSFEHYRMRTDRHFLHQKLVAFATQHSVQAAARTATSVNPPAIH